MKDLTSSILPSFFALSSNKQTNKQQQKKNMRSYGYVTLSHSFFSLSLSLSFVCRLQHYRWALLWAARGHLWHFPTDARCVRAHSHISAASPQLPIITSHAHTCIWPALTSRGMLGLWDESLLLTGLFYDCSEMSSVVRRLENVLIVLFFFSLFMEVTF